ncbi:WD40 repeat-like protein [Aureobasidium subglaciale]|nr:WD40 repeat-like protein [Aureobasidium subglaciale]
MQASATFLYTLKAHKDEVARLLFSPDGKTLAAHDDSILKLWDVETKAVLSKFEDTEDMFFEMAFSPDSQWIAAASGDGSARIWDARTGHLERTLSVEDERMLSLVFSSDSKSLATGSEVLRIWDAETGELLHTLSDSGITSLSITAMMERIFFARNGQVLISACPNTSTICIWSTESWKLKHTIRGHCICLSPNEKHLVVSSDTFTTTKIYDTTTWQLQSTLDTQDQDEDQEIFPSTFSPDNKVIATHSDRKIALWDISSGKGITRFTDLTRKVSAPQFSPDGRVLIAGAKKCGIRVWNVETGDCLLVHDPEDGARDLWNSDWIRGGPPAFEVLFGDGGAQVAIAFPDGSVRIWDVKWEST